MDKYFKPTSFMQSNPSSRAPIAAPDPKTHLESNKNKNRNKKIVKIRKMNERMNKYKGKEWKKLESKIKIKKSRD